MPPIDQASFAQMCSDIASGRCEWNEICNPLSDAVFAVSEKIGMEAVLRELKAVSAAVAASPEKSRARLTTLYGLSLLIGQVLQDFGDSAGACEWLERAVCIDASGDTAWHELALNALSRDDLPNAVRALQSEIAVAPGNYYSYMLLAEIYDRLDDDSDMERVLTALLDRDPGNLRALHALISHYRRRYPDADVTILIDRIVSVDTHLVNLDLVIWTSYMLERGRGIEAIDKLGIECAQHADHGLAHLLRAWVHGELHQYAARRSELVAFVRASRWQGGLMRVRLDEFGQVFGREARRQMVAAIAAQVPGDVVAILHE